MDIIQEGIFSEVISKARKPVYPSKKSNSRYAGLQYQPNTPGQGFIPILHPKVSNAIFTRKIVRNENTAIPPPFFTFKEMDNKMDAKIDKQNTG